MGERNLPPLSPRDIEMLKARAGGFSNKEIAKQHGLSPKTVKLYLSATMSGGCVSIYAKLGPNIHNTT